MIEKRLILALVLSILILSLWNIIFPPPKPVPLPRAQEQIASSSDKEIKSQPLVPQAVKSKNIGEEVVLDTALYKTTFFSEGGLLHSFQLKQYPEEKIRMADIDKAITFSRDEKLKKRLILFKEKYPVTSGTETVSVAAYLENSFPLSFYWTAQDEDLNTVLYKIEKKDKTLIFSYHTANSLTLIKKYLFRDDSYSLDLEIKLINTGEKALPAAPIQVKYGPGFGLSTDLFGKGDPYYRGAVLVKEAGRDKVIRENFRRVKSGASQIRNFPDAVWAGLENKYFMAAFIPGSTPASLWLEKDTSGYLHLGIKCQAPELKPGDEVTKNFSIYLGPKQKETLSSLNVGLEESIDYGRVSAVLKIMEILKFLYKLTRNWGVAIILLTILTKIILWPLTQKSFRSMEEMQRLQPYLKELRLKYKDDPRRMNQEVMKLYREHKVNPMSGCLPMLLQMPIFIALFTTLRNTIELRGASFLWMKDLSLPDTVAYIAGSIPLNPLPLVMGLSTYWQQKISTGDPEQAKMMVFMPVIFTVMFYNFSSGLVLYWFVQNILTIGHQYIMKMASRGKNGAQ